MKRRNVFFPIVLLALVFLVFLIRRWNEPVRKEAFDRQPKTLVFTERALCFMACRQITRADVTEIMKKGVIHFNQSDRRSKPCPVFALQGTTGSGKSIRVVFAQCTAETHVLTSYFVRREIDCPCAATKGGQS